MGSVQQLRSEVSLGRLLRTFIGKGSEMPKEMQRNPRKAGRKQNRRNLVLMNMTDQAEIEQKGFRTIRTAGNGEGPRI